MTHDANARAFRFVMFAVIALGAATVALSVYYTNILSSRDFCATVAGSKIVSNAAPNIDVVKACASLMAVQLSAVATNSYINSGSIAICLVGLVILVVAGGRLSLKAGRDGVEGALSHDDVAEAADAVAGAAVGAADGIKGANS